MWWSYLLNLVMGIAMLIIMLFCIGDPENVINSDAPYLILTENLGSFEVALTLSIILFLLIFSSNIHYISNHVARNVGILSRSQVSLFQMDITSMTLVPPSLMP